MKHKIKDKYGYFYNIESKEGTWVEPDHFVHDSSQLTKEDIQVCLQHKHTFTVFSVELKYVSSVVHVLFPLTRVF